MDQLPFIALIPVREGPAAGCVVIYPDGREVRRYCSVEKYMGTVASFLGNNNRTCRKLFQGKRGTGIRLNDGSIFVQVKLSPAAPTLGYVRLDAIAGLCSDEQGKGVILLKNDKLLKTFWSLETIDRHMRMVRQKLEDMELPAL